MDKKFRPHLALLSIISILAFIITACSKDDDTTIIKPSIKEPNQPNALVPEKGLTSVIGFWDFNNTGKNRVTGESGDWVIDGISYDEKGLVFGKNITKEQALKSRVKLFDASQGADKGLSNGRYFSGAVKFKVVKDPDEAFSFTILSFGTKPRFLELKNLNGKIRMETNNGNTATTTDIEIPEKIWNVLYFRYEGFQVPDNNKFYLQLNDGEEVSIDLKDFEIESYANDTDINLGFSSNGDTFKGNIDWMILARGGMKPENAQYLVKDFQPGIADDSDPKQPSPLMPGKGEYTNIGFWDFNTNGKNAVIGESGDWPNLGIPYGDQGLKFDNTVTGPVTVNSRIKLFNPDGDREIGMQQQRYFSGAVKFKVASEPGKDLDHTILSFGSDPRWLELNLLKGKIQMQTKDGEIKTTTDIEVPEKVWNVLYFRYEEFSDNNLFLQLNDGKEVAVDLKDFKIDAYAKDTDINLGFSGSSNIFKGSVDWVILSLGRMKPEGVQYLVNEFHK